MLAILRNTVLGLVIAALAIVLVPLMLLTVIAVGGALLWVGLAPAAGACYAIPFCPFDPLFSWAYPF